MSGQEGNRNVGVAKESKKPKYSRFTQQELPACKPLLTPAWVIASLVLVGAVFIPIGIVALSASQSVVEVKARYDDECLPGLTNQQRDAHVRDYELYPSKQCRLVIQVPKDMKPPIFVYYQLYNFYQNHRRYVKSRSDSQLRGESVSNLDVCKPEAYLDGNKSKPINPCGLIAWSLFNDSYSFSAGTQPIAVDEHDISWASDRNSKFGNKLPENFNTNASIRGGGTLDPNTPLDEDEHLIVWMRTAAFPTFRKLWGKIHTPLKKNEVLTVVLQNQYNTYAFNGQKWIVLSTASWLGGRNDFLGIAYIAVGGLCMALAILFFLLRLINPRPLGDTSYLSWNKKPLGM